MPPASSWSTIAFVLIVLAVCAALVAAMAVTAGDRRRDVVIAIAAVVAWLVVTGGIAASGVLRVPGFPPRIMMYFAFLNISALVFAFSPVGTRLTALPLHALVGFHAVRLPLELILHQWSSEGVVPVQMTFTGHNFDVVTGGFAIVAALLLRRRPDARIAWAFNLVGIGLLFAVIAIVVMSSPIPLRRYLNDPPVLLGYEFPYTWIGSVCVTGALAGHVILFRKLFRGQLAVGATAR